MGIIKILCIFAFALLMVKLKIPLGISLTISGIILCFWFGLAVSDVIKIGMNTVTNLQTIFLTVVVITILLLSRLMEQTQQLDEIVTIFKKKFRHTWISSAALPALIGLLPMPGGAVFSAPLIDGLEKNQSLPADEKAAINHWFRHIWEYWWPLYPGIILAISLTGVDAWKLMGCQLPFTVFAIVGGYYFLLRPLKKRFKQEDRKQKQLSKLNALRILLPILLVVFLTGVLSLAGTFLLKQELISKTYAKHLPILLALATSIIWVVIDRRVRLGTVIRAAFNRSSLSIIVMVTGIMFFKTSIIESDAVFLIKDNLHSYNIPVIVIAMILPFLAGIITGITVGFVGATFPLLVTLVHSSGLEEKIIPYAVIAFIFGFVGVLLSPVHLCLILTRDYFKTDLMHIYRLLIIPSLLLLLSGIVFFILFGT